MGAFARFLTVRVSGTVPYQGRAVGPIPKRCFAEIECRGSLIIAA